jgi:predicted alpha/beta-hydrolase family hydrolase
MAGTLFIFAHGAGSHKDHPGMLALDATLARRGITSVRFDFPYRERGGSRPDPMPVLTAHMRAVAERAREEARPDRLILGGRSMGGRAASMLAADGFACDGVLLFAYPLHPAGRPEKLRDAHLPLIPVPVLCFNGTRDALCTRDLMERAVGGLPRWEQRWLEGADHSLHVLKSSGRTDPDVMFEIEDASAAWLSHLAQRKGTHP